MADVNSNAVSVTRVRQGGEQAAAPRHMQQVEVEERQGGQNEIGVEQRGGDEGYVPRHASQGFTPQQEVEQPVQQQPIVDTLASQAVSQLPGRQAEPTTQQRTRPETEASRMSGMAEASHPVMQQAPMQQAPQARIPVLDVSQIGNLDVMSSRKPAFSNEALAAMKANSNELRNASANPSANPARTTGSRPSVVSTGKTKANTTYDARAGQAAESAVKEPVAEEVSAANNVASSQAVGRPDTVMNRPVGWEAKKREPKLRQPSLKRSKAVTDAEKERYATSFNKEGVGYRIYGKINGLRTLAFREVGVGTSELYQAAQQNPNMLNRLFRTYDEAAPDVSTLSATELADYVNSHEIYAATYKPPDNRSQDAQSRRLRVVPQPRGIYLHPVMAAMYTADFDGDDFAVTFDPKSVKTLFDPMRQIVDIFGESTINNDFMPVVELFDDPEGMDVRTFVRTVMLKSVSQADWKVVNPLIDAIIKLGETEKEPKKQMAGWAKVFIEAREVSEQVARGQARHARRSEMRVDSIMERIVKDIYQTMHDLNVMTELSGADIVSTSDLPEPRTYSDMALYEVLDGMVEGKAPNNFQDLKVMLTGYLGDVEGKNAPFRFSADVGKVTKMDTRLQVGNGDFVVDPNNPGELKSVFETTMKYSYSHRMAVGYKKAGRSMYYTQALRERVMSEVGMPSEYDDFMQFIGQFVESYEIASAMINQANISFSTNRRILEDTSAVSPLKSSEGGMTFDDIAEPLISVYGLQSVGTMFQTLSTTGIMGDWLDPLWKGTPGHRTKLTKYGQDASKAYEREYEANQSEFWITGKYLSWSIRKFAHENRLLRGKRNPVTIKSVRSADNAYAEFQMLLAIADKVTGTASKFNEAIYGKEVRDEKGRKSIDYSNTMVEMMSKLLDDIARNDGTDRMLWVNDDVDALIAGNPDLFHYFDMDSPAGFLHSNWAQAMLDARHDMDLLGGIRLAMVAQWRMDRITSLQAEADAMDSNDNIRQWAIMQNNIQLAKDELAASSEVWHGIIREFEMEDTPGQRSVFQMMRENKDGLLYKRNQVTGEEYAWDTSGENGTYYARSFWNNPGGHETLRSVIEDPHMGIKQKQDIIADVVRYWENDLYLSSYEVGFQMEIGNDSSYSLKSGGKQSALKSYRDFEQAFNRWSKTCQDRLVEDVTAAANKYRRRRGSLMNTLQRLSEHPEELIEIDDHMFADAIMSVFDKTYAQTEKAKQHPWDNSIYNGLSEQLNGGLMNDVERTNDRLLGIQSIRSVGVHDVVRVLFDPNETIEVYDDYGCTSGPVNRNDIIRSVLGREPSRDVESDIWDLLIQNPRIASAIRLHGVNTLANMEGKTYLGASLSIKETIEVCNSGHPDPIKRTKYLLRDHPDYAALVSLATPAKGAVTRKHRERVVQTEAYLAYRIAQAAVTDADPAVAAKWILGDMGITEDRLKEVMRSDLDRYFEQLKLPVMKQSTDETDADAMAIWTDALRNLTSDIEEVRKDLPQGIGVQPVSRPSHLGVDISSLASYWDVTQDLGGAKTATSTGIEGGETFRWGLWSSFIQSNDKYANLKSAIHDVDGSWNGLWTSEGQLEVSEDNTVTVGGKALSEFGKDVEIVSAVPEGYKVQDRSADRYGNQVSSLKAYMVSKRSNGAEKNNLKAKKAGHDSSRSITKMRGRIRIITEEDGTTHRASMAELRNQFQTMLDDTHDIRAVQMRLAGMLLDENAKLDYKDLTLSNYMCMAELMVRQTEDGRIVLRTLPMLFDAIKYRIGTSVDSMSNEQITRAVEEIVNDVSETGVGVMKLDPAMVFDYVRPRSKSMVKDGISPHSSSFERNYDLMQAIEREAMQDGVLPMSEQSAERISYGLVKDRRTKVSDVVSVVERVRVMRGYNVVGHSGRDGRLGRVNWTVGPTNAVVIGDEASNAKEVEEICDRAYKYGMTVIVSSRHLDLVPREYMADAMPCNNVGDMLIPMFDIRLNGSEATPDNGGQFAIFQLDPSRLVISVEDPLNFFQLGDAQVKPTDHFKQRVRNIETGSQPISMEDLFPNVFQNPDFAHCSFSVSFASGDTIARLIANGVKCTIDYGLVEGAKGWEQRVHDVDRAIKRYQDRWSSTDADGTMCTGDQACEAGDIVAWAECAITDLMTGEESYVLAPIIPFPLHGTQRGPETYSVEQVATVNDDNMTIAVDWRNASDVTKSNAKYFDSSGGANKGIIDFVDSIPDVNGKPLMLRDGSVVDCYIAKASTDSRKVGTDRRVKTMITLMMLARMHGYNFARTDGAFPDRPDIKERLLHERIPAGEWARMYKEGIRFSSDPKIDGFLRFECNKVIQNGGNFSDYLGNLYENDEGVEENTCVFWEFEAMFERGMEYENCLLKFLHSMDPTLCPDGFDDESGDTCTFRLKPDAKDFDYGVLEMEVPYPLPDGRVAYLWANVYIGMSFFGEEYSGFSRPNVDGASNFLDAMNTYSQYGAELDERQSRFRNMWATSDLGRVRDGGAIGRA